MILSDAWLAVTAESQASPDGLLVERALAGERRAFDELVARFFRPVFGLAYRMTGSASEAEDLCQEIFLRAWRNLDRFDRTMPFGPWLRRLAANHVLNHLRRRRPTVSIEEEPHASVADPGPSPEAAAASRIDARALRQALLELPESQRLAVTLRFVEGLTAEEVSEAMGVPRNTVKTWIFRGRESLKALMGRNP